MQWNLTTILLIAGIFLLGYGIGLGEMYLRQTKRVKRLEEELQRKEAASTTDVLPVQDQPASVLRLWFDDRQNAALELDGVALSSPQQITPAQRRRLIALINALRPWLEYQAVRESSPSITPPTPTPPMPKPSHAGMGQLPQPSPVTPPPPKPSEPSVAALSIVEQIDQILQRLLAGTPFAGQVRLRERAGGGIAIQVGVKQYTAVDEVAEAEVKTAIRAAIAEWERRA